jgi:class 3 adenylate cyclase
MPAMPEAGVTVERRFAAPRELVWALLSDTHRYNRALGMPLPRYSWREVDGRRQRVAEAKQGGVELSWVELPYEWIEGRLLATRRTFLRGPAASGGLLIEVEDDGEGGCVARVVASGQSRSWLLRALGPLVRAHLRRRLEAYMDAVAEVLKAPPGPLAADPSQPPAVRAQALLGGVQSEVASGQHTPVDTAELQRRAERLAAAAVDAKAAEHLVTTLAQRPDEEVAQMRPFELARQWGEDRRRVLQAFLHGTQAGLVDLDWQINCPVCRVAAQVVTSLAEVGRDLHCEACNIRYDVDFGANVEAVFRCNKAIRAVEPAVYCTASPAFRPHVLAQLRVEPGASRELSLSLADGRLHLRTLGGQRAWDLADDEPPARLEVEIGPDAVTARAHGRAEGGRTELVLRSTLDEPAYLLVERGGWSSDAVLGSVVASLPDFVELFATEAPAAGLELSIGHITLLFSDLTGSTALYERVGDARAYAVVQEHFRVMEQAIADHEGAVIKTMGDAVMASFVTPHRAVAAARQAIRETEARHGELGIGVKLGVHEGPCLAVRANDRLDFFGTTVNLAARLQGQAGAGELVVMRALAEVPAVGELLAGAPRRGIVARLKGIADERELVAVDLRPTPAVPSGPG